MGKLRPVTLDGVCEHIDTDNKSVSDILDSSKNIVSVTAFNGKSGEVEVITKDEAINKPLSDYHDIQTNHTEAVRG